MTPLLFDFMEKWFTFFKFGEILKISNCKKSKNNG